MGGLTKGLLVAMVLFIFCGWFFVMEVDGKLPFQVRHVRRTPVSELNAYERAKFGIRRFEGDYDGHVAPDCSLESTEHINTHKLVRRGARAGDDYKGDELCLNFRRLPRKFHISQPEEHRDDSPPCKYQFYKVTPEHSTSGEDVCDYICGEDNTNCVGQYRDRITSMPLCDCGFGGNNCSALDESQVTAMHGIVNGRIPQFLEPMSRRMDQRSRNKDYGKGDDASDDYCSTYGEYMGEKCNAICRKAVDEEGNHFGGGYHVALPVTDNSCKDLPYYVLEACVCSCQYIIDERIQCLA